MFRRQFMQCAGAAALAAAGPAAWPGAARAGAETAGGRAFGSYWRAAGAVRPGRLAAVVERIDAALSPYRAGSELSRFNRADTRDWQPLSESFGTVLAGALAAAERSGGAFDPTVGPLVARYGFGPIEAAADGFETGGLDRIETRPGALRKTGAATLDLCGIAKGHALDRIVAEAVPGAALVELGGEVFARGRHPDGRRWRVAVERPDGGGLAALLEIEDRAVATSGDRPQGYTVRGRRYGHIIDPRRGVPATGTLGSVSVIAATAMEADAMATALFALGTEAAATAAEALNLDTLMLVADGGGWRQIATGRAEDWILA